ncbi:MAG TPA: SH3 domain-containing protein [Caulobacteraceae bacterium]|nr:SH3 domain-containing protein [Caulobacteraceae bacterium]
MSLAGRFLRGKARTIGAGLGLVVAMLAGQGLGADEDRPTPSGLPVPRYVSLKFDVVNARSGPGDDHRLLWVYHVRGLPVQVVAENNEWRRICDPDGSLSWVHERTTDGHRTVMRTQAGPAPILDRPRHDGIVTAYLASRALAAVERCARGWCKVHVGTASGWINASDVWGANDAPQCR